MTIEGVEESKMILNFGWYFRLDPSTSLGMTKQQIANSDIYEDQN